MGQRLIIEIKKNETVLANGYYQWGAYTSSSLLFLEKIMNSLEDVKHQDDVVYAIKLLEKTGATMMEDEQEAAKEITDENFEKYNRRGEGVINFTPEGLEKTKDAELDKVEVHLDKKIIEFGVFIVTDKTTYMESNEDLSEEEFQALPIVDFDLDIIPFSKFKETYEKVFDNLEYGMRLKGDNDEVVEFD